MELADFMKEIAREAGGILAEKFGTINTWRSKASKGDVVTEVDEASEEYLMRRIKEQYPDDHILSEESGSSGKGEQKRLWILDPLDGTRNYTMGVPFFCVSIGVVVNNKPEVGVVYDPIHDEMFYAERGKGAYVNDVPIAVSEEDRLEDSVISVSWVKHKVDGTRFADYIRELSRDTSYFRRFGSAALVLCYVASGRLHAYLQAGLNPWDVAAGALLIEEAGGVITDFDGDPIDLSHKNIEVVCGNPKLHKLLIEEVLSKRSQ